MCRICKFFLLQGPKESMSDEARDFNNMETRAVIKFFFPARQGAEGNSRHSERNIREHAPSYATVKAGWPKLNVVIFRPVMRFALDDTKL